MALSDLRAMRSTSLKLTGRFFICAITVMSSVAAGFARPAPRNLFTELLGKSDAEISAKIDAGWQHLFYGRDSDQRVYYPVGEGMAYIADTGNGDVRSEGMSYGMMIAVQLDRRDEFDRLWRWAKRYMYHADGPRRGYFAWQCAFDGRQIDPGSASDGEIWFATALFFAAHRWSTNDHQAGQSEYAADAHALLHAIRDSDRGNGITAIFDPVEKQVVFAPTTAAARFTDPSYHVPAFTALWSQWAKDAADRTFWSDVTQTSRSFLQRAAHPKTGLMPEYAHFDGRPYQETDFGPGKGDFGFDAWRTLANVALDHAWFAADPWQVTQSNRVLAFLGAQGPQFANRYALDGRPLSKDTSVGLVAMAAVAGLAADPKLAQPFVERLWNSNPPTGRWRYYDGLLYQLALLQVSGRFRIHEPTVGK
jgi:oligosaccharide reducing-end xylanase